MITLVNNVSTNAIDSEELVYDGKLNRWIVFGFRD